jgi:hypothetical protein
MNVRRLMFWGGWLAVAAFVVAVIAWTFSWPWL